MAESAADLYRAGKLKEAIALQVAEVKAHPADTQRRGFLCELLCIAGDLERADTHLDAMGKQDPQSIPGISLFRQLVRAETARRDFHASGRVPELLVGPTEAVKLSLEAAVHLHAGEAGRAVELLAQVEEVRPKVHGTCDGKAFDDFRDGDDLLSAVFEVLTSNGKYYWVPVEAVESMEFREPVRPRDVLWPRVHMVVRGGPDGEVYLPSVYAPGPDAPDAERLGRLTEWTGGDGSPVRGVGLRTLVVGEEARTFLNMKEVQFGAEG